MTTDIREGLALALVNSDRARRNWPAARWKDFDESTQRDYLANADCALAFIRAHDGHAEFVKNICIWTEEHDGDTWATGCGNVFQFIDGGPEYNQFKYCCYCGHEIKPESLLAELAKKNRNG